MIESAVIVATTLALILVSTAVLKKWPVKQWATDAALLPFLAIGWLIGATIYAAELMYYAIITGYEQGRGKEEK